MSIAMENSHIQNNEVPQLVYTHNIAGKLEDYFCNIMSLKLKLAQLILLDPQPSADAKLEKIEENELEILAEKIDDFFKAYKSNIKPNLNNLFIQSALFANKFINYLPFLKEDLNLLNIDSSLNSYKAPFSLLKTHIKKMAETNLQFLKEINQINAQLEAIYKEAITLLESLVSTSSFKQKIKELKNEMDSDETEIDKYNQTVLRANIFEKNSAPLVLHSAHEENKIDNSSLLGYTNMPRESIPPSITFSVTRYENTLNELANNSSQLKTIFLLAQFSQDVLSILKKLNSLIFDMDQCWNDILAINSKLESFIDKNKTNSEAINKAKISIEIAKAYFLNLRKVSEDLLSKIGIEVSHYFKTPRNLKLLFILKETEITINDFEFEYI